MTPTGSTMGAIDPARISLLDENGRAVSEHRLSGLLFGLDRASYRTRFSLDEAGLIVPKSRKKIFDWKTGRGPDGMCLDQQGRLYVAGGRNEPVPPFETADEFKGGVYVFSPEGELLTFVAIPRDEVTNCAFGGSDLKTLYITAGGTLWSLRTQSPGKLAWTPQ